MMMDKQYFCVTISRREKDGAQPIIFYMYLMVYLIMVNMSFSENADVFFFTGKLKWKILLQEISDATKLSYIMQ